MGKYPKLSYIGACEQQAWHLELRRRDGSDSTLLRVPFRCKSWRHAGPCRLWCGACDFVRCLAAIEENTCWVSLVLTYPARDWPNKAELFRFGYVSWSRLRKRLVYEFGPIKYIQTWEITKKGTPHVNVCVSNEWLYWQVRAKRKEFERGWLRQSCLECGFGKEAFAKAVYSKAGMVGYLTKLCNELTGADVKDQVPVTAPPGFRRLRASQGLLPPREKSKEFTGRIVPIPLTQCQDSGEMVKTDDPEWLKEKLKWEEIECLVQARLPCFKV